MSYFDKTIDEKYAQANTYYADGNHVRAFDWLKISESERKAGLNQAQREVDLYLGTDLEDTYDDQDFPIGDNPNFRPDYAIFEHALFPR